METFIERNYKKEYDNYHSKPEQKKRRAGRNKARRDVVKSVKDSKQLIDKDVHHKDNNPMNNDKSNLSIVTQKYNRTEPRKRNEEREPQDKDIADRKGTQPAKYFKGLKKSTKSKRDAHFKKGKEKSDSDPSAYKDAPGDKKARKEPMRKSKYTKDYQKMYGEVLAWTEARAFHDFGANSPSANNKIRDIANKAKDYKDAMNKIITFAKGTSTPSKKFAQAIGAGKFTDFEPDKDIAQNVKDFIQQRDRVKKLGPRANDPDQNLQVQLKGAEDLRTGSDVKLDDGKTIKVTQKNAKLINMALDRVKPQMRVQLIKLLGKNKQSFMKALGAIKRSMA